MRTRSTVLLIGTYLLCADAFVSSPTFSKIGGGSNRLVNLLATASDKAVPPTTYTPIYDFSSPDDEAVKNFERIDDAIMGGISLSSMKQQPDESFARWSGICRVDGGGFCGARTLPFEEPLRVGDAEGIYILCQLTSDDEPERRVWKITTRTEESRGEQLYQAEYELPKTSNGEWNRVLVPFSRFVQVRGPRVIENAPSLNTTSGIFQIGLSLSKFQIASSASELDNFRAGFFELQIKEIGIFGNEAAEAVAKPPVPLTKEAMEKKKPVMLKILSPVFKTLFSEKRRRRDSALRLLKARGMTRIQAILFGLQIRSRARGKFGALFQTLGMMTGDILRSSLFLTLKLALIYPLIAVRRLRKAISKEKSI